jgi:phage terminase large subunit
VCSRILKVDCFNIYRTFFLLNLKAKYEIYFCGSGKTFLYHPATRSVEFFLEMSGKKEVSCRSVIKTSQLMLYREIIAVCSEIHTKHINKPCGQNVELLDVQSCFQ